jgi:hypothetical protein
MEILRTLRLHLWLGDAQVWCGMAPEGFFATGYPKTGGLFCIIPE